jgi:FK506-binding protein 4/5
MNHRTASQNSEDKDFQDLSGDGALLKKVIKSGNGEQIPKDVVAIVHYTGKLTNGEIFDSSKQRNQPFEFNIGKRDVILGWDYGVQTMCKGEVAILKCAPEYAYGSRSVGPIPGNSTLLFEVELLGWKERDQSFVTQILAVLVVGAIAIYFYYNRLK